MPVLSNVERLAGILAAARDPNSQAIIDVTYNRKGAGSLEGRNDPRPFSLNS